jgi:hypothetical protein
MERKPGQHHAGYIGRIATPGVGWKKRDASSLRKRGLEQAPVPDAYTQEFDMTHPTKAELFAICQDAKSLDVMNVHGSACDNAAATIGWPNRLNATGGFTDAFIANWFGSLQSILADGDDVTPEARTFFESHHVAY